MHDLEDLVRQALTTAPTETSLANPVEVVSGRLQRARRRLAGGAAVAALLIAAAVVVPLTAIQRDGSARVGVSHSSSPTPSPGPGFGNAKVWLRNSAVQSVAAGNGADGTPTVWAVGYGTRKQGAETAVFDLDPRTGAVRNRVFVPSPATVVYLGLGRVWVFGGGDGGYPNGAISRIDPATGTVTTLQLRGGPGTAFFFRDAAYATFGPGGELVRIGGASGPLHSGPGIPGTAGVLFPSQDGTLWVELHRGWSHVALTDHGARTLGMTAGWHGPLIGQVAGTYWMPDTTPMGACRMRSVALSFKSSGVTATYGKWVATDGSPDEVSADPVGGLYVAMGAQLCQPQSLSAIAYYSADALKSAAPRPSAEQDESDINQMVTDPAGGVVLVTGGTLLQHWTH